MKNLTDKQQGFVDAKIAGMKTPAAAIAAGYSPVSASVQGNALMQRADVKSAIAAGKRMAKQTNGRRGNAVEEEEVDDNPKNRMPKDKYTDAKEFLTDAMNHKHLPVAARAEYAKALMPYQHARIGETGKKEKAKDRAKEIVGRGNGRGVFGTKGPPQLRVVGE